MAKEFEAEALRAIEAKKSRLIAQRENNERKIKELSESNQQIEREIADCDAAARVFGASGAAVAPEPSPFLEGSVRDAVLRHLERAFPAPLKSARLEEMIEAERKIRLHWKTIGMTLYRLSKEGLVRRQGHSWFFVPQDAETKNPGASPPGFLQL